MEDVEYIHTEGLGEGIVFLEIVGGIELCSLVGEEEDAVTEVKREFEFMC